MPYLDHFCFKIFLISHICVHIPALFIRSVRSWRLQREDLQGTLTWRFRSIVKELQSMQLRLITIMQTGRRSRLIICQFGLWCLFIPKTLGCTQASTWSTCDNWVNINTNLEIGENGISKWYSMLCRWWPPWGMISKVNKTEPPSASPHRNLGFKILIHWKQEGRTWSLLIFRQLLGSAKDGNEKETRTATCQDSLIQAIIPTNEINTDASTKLLIPHLLVFLFNA